MPIHPPSLLASHLLQAARVKVKAKKRAMEKVMTSEKAPVSIPLSELGGVLGEQEDLLQRGLLTPFGTSLQDVEIHQAAGEFDLFEDREKEAEQDELDVQEEKRDQEKKAKEKRETPIAPVAQEKNQGKKAVNQKKPAAPLAKKRRQEVIELSSDEEEEQEEESEEPRSLNSDGEDDLVASEEGDEEVEETDDIDDEAYKNRLRRWRADPTALIPHIPPEHDDYVSFPGGFKLPQRLYSQIFDHQRTGSRWLWEIHQQEAGGIVADEMGLGKTILVLGFLAGPVEFRFSCESLP